MAPEFPGNQQKRLPSKFAVGWGAMKGTRMPTEPIMVRKSTHDLAMLVANNFATAGLSEADERYYLQNKDEVVPAIHRAFARTQSQATGSIEVVEPKIVIPDLRSTGPTFADWLVAREVLHKHLTGETVNLCQMFIIPEATLTRTDIMPVFRLAGATNRMALDWKVKLGMNPSYEEDKQQGGVDRYRNANGPTQPQLGFVARSVRPDENTLGKHAKSPDGLLGVEIAKDQAWLNLFGWSTADDLHFLITASHLDSVETLTWFPDDRLPGDQRVARGSWSAVSARARFYWFSRGFCPPYVGGRLATFFPLRQS